MILLFCCFVGAILTLTYRSSVHKLVALRKKLWRYTHPEQYTSAEHLEFLNVTLFESFRKGNFHKMLAGCSSEELIELLPVVLSLLCH